MSLFAPFLAFAVVGSRSGAAPGVAAAVAAAFAGGCSSLLVGCAAGVDAVGLAAGLRVRPAALSVFAAFGPGGVGSAGRASSVVGVAAAAAAGVAVRWWSGGAASLPLRARLARRSAALVAALVAAPAPLLLCFPAGPCPPAVRPARSWPGGGSGSWAAAALAAGLGVAVVVVGPPPPAAWGGAWSAVVVAPGVAGWLWSPPPVAVQSSFF